MSGDSDELDPWVAHLSRFRIADAQVTAVPGEPPNDDLTVLRSLSLVVEEGRYENLREDAAGQPAPSMLVYGCYVREAGSPLSSSWAGSDAHIVINGTHENGWAVTIAGPGAIGRDENGALEISFELPPRMAVVSPERLR